MYEIRISAYRMDDCSANDLIEDTVIASFVTLDAADAYVAKLMELAKTL